MMSDVSSPRLVFMVCEWNIWQWFTLKVFISHSLMVVSMDPEARHSNDSIRTKSRTMSSCESFFNRPSSGMCVGMMRVRELKLESWSMRDDVLFRSSPPIASSVWVVIWDKHVIKVRTHSPLWLTPPIESIMEHVSVSQAWIAPETWQITTAKQNKLIFQTVANYQLNISTYLIHNIQAERVCTWLCF